MQRLFTFEQSLFLYKDIFNLFILDLSFIGWYLLGMLAFGIGVLFVRPYQDATNAELYIILRKEAISNRLTTSEELNIAAM